MEHFYAWFFVRHPEIRAMFPLAMSEHRERVLGALARIVWSMDSPAALDSYLRQLGRDHRKFAVKDKHYEAFFGAFLDTVRHFSGYAWTADTEAAGEARPRLHRQDHAGGPAAAAASMRRPGGSGNCPA